MFFSRIYRIYNFRTKSMNEWITSCILSLPWRMHYITILCKCLVILQIVFCGVCYCLFINFKALGNRFSYYFSARKTINIKNKVKVINFVCMSYWSFWVLKCNNFIIEDSSSNGKEFLINLLYKQKRWWTVVREEGVLKSFYM